MKINYQILFCFFILNFVSAQTDSNQLDEKGMKHGVWKGFYPESKRPRYEGTFNHGKETGVFNFYDDTKAKSIIATREFNATDHSAYTIFYDQSKNKVSEGKEVNKLYDGQWKYYHLNSKEIMTIENYKSGKLDGLKTIFYPNTKIAEETNYKNGNKDGLYKKYSTTGIILEQSNYKNGQYDGQAIYKDPLDKIVAQGKYINGLKKGIWLFYENGKLVSKENMSKPAKKFKKNLNPRKEED